MGLVATNRVQTPVGPSVLSLSAGVASSYGSVNFIVVGVSITDR